MQGLCKTYGIILWITYARICSPHYMRCLSRYIMHTYADICTGKEYELPMKTYSSICSHVHGICWNMQSYTDICITYANICIKYASIGRHMHSIITNMQIYGIICGNIQKYGEICMMYWNTCKYMHYVSSNITLICTSIQIIFCKMQFCASYKHLYVLLHIYAVLYAIICTLEAPHMQLYAFICIHVYINAAFVYIWLCEYNY